MDMTNWLQKRVRLSPKETALVFEGKEETFEEISEAVKQLAGKLFALGIRKDEMVALLGKNQSDDFFTHSCSATTWCGHFISE